MFPATRFEMTETLQVAERTSCLVERADSAGIRSSHQSWVIINTWVFGSVLPSILLIVG